MAQLVLSARGSDASRFSEVSFPIRKKVTTVGSDPVHDIQVAFPGAGGLLFTLVRQEQGFELVPGSVRVLVNGQVVKRATKLASCDRVEWGGGAAIFLVSPPLIAGSEAGSLEASTSARALSVLQNLASTLQDPGSLQAALHQALDALIEMSGAEGGYLLSELGRPGWELIASRHDGAASRVQRRELFSNTILQEALTRREHVHVENIIGHPWAAAASVIEARIFSAACIPLCVGERVLGAVYLFTRSPGRSIRRESLGELSLMATQAALLLGMQAELGSAKRENARLRTLVTEWPTSLVSAGASSPLSEVSRKIAKLAPTPLSVLVLGETGTGKELVARELHSQSPRSGGPFVAINCAAIPSTLLESVLFGHEKGAFTGALRAQTGRFVQAQGGTLFLDEIGDLPLDLQAKLLRVLQEREVEPLGSGKPVAIDVRLVAATHQDLEALARQGKFRQDLFFRLNGAILRLPPLRERPGDIGALAEHFLRKIASPLRLSSSALRALERHPWPGNVRELEQVVTRAALLAEGAEISAEDLELADATPGPQDPAMRLGWESAPDSLAARSLQDAQLAFTRDFVQRALDRNGGRRAEAAVELGISERTLYRLLAGGGTDKSVRTT